MPFAWLMVSKSSKIKKGSLTFSKSFDRHIFFMNCHITSHQLNSRGQVFQFLLQAIVDDSNEEILQCTEERMLQLNNERRYC